MTLSTKVDGIVVVTRIKTVRRPMMNELARQLSTVPTPVLGVVVLEQRDIDETYYPAASKGLNAVVPAKRRPAADTAEKF